MITPKKLQIGGLLAFASPAKSIGRESVVEAVRLLHEFGFRYRLDEEVFATYHQFAGDTALRTKHFQQLLDDPELDAIICMRGGYGSLQIVDALDFTVFREHPKWIVGYSDITVLHARLQREGFESLHATMPINFTTNSLESLQSLFAHLQGNRLNYEIPTHALNRFGIAKGQLVGGNLSILYSLQGSNLFPDCRNKILFIEDLDEYLYHIDRMILSLKRAGCFNQLAGLIVGGMTDMKDNDIPFGMQVEEIIASQLADFDFPIAFGFPAGHIPDNRSLILGRQLELHVNAENTTLVFDEKH